MLNYQGCRICRIKGYAPICPHSVCGLDVQFCIGSPRGIPWQATSFAYMTEKQYRVPRDIEC